MIGHSTTRILLAIVLGLSVPGAAEADDLPKPPPSCVDLDEIRIEIGQPCKMWPDKLINDVLDKVLPEPGRP